MSKNDAVGLLNITEAGLQVFHSFINKESIFKRYQHPRLADVIFGPKARLKEFYFAKESLIIKKLILSS